MRTFNFKARSIGASKYLTYTMGEETELDEDVLDYCEEQSPAELLEIIYEEDDAYDYLTYDISEQTSLEEFISEEMNQRRVLLLFRNIAGSLISLKEQAIHLSYILLNKRFVYIDKESCNVRYICLPVESKGSLSAEFKGFMRHLLANMRYDVDEDLNYVGKLLTYINGDSFNLRGLVGLTEALMEESGIDFEQAADIEAEGVEVVTAEKEEPGITDFMNSTADDAPLPEIGDDEEEAAEEEAAPEADAEELESILPAGMQPVEEEASEETGAAAETEQAAPEEAGAEEPEETAPEEFAETEITAQVAEEPEEEAVEEEAPEEELESILPPGMPPVAEEVPVMEAAPKPQEETESGFKIKGVDTHVPKEREKDLEAIKNRIAELVGEAKAEDRGTHDLDNILGSKPPVIKKHPVRVNRAAMIQNAQAELEAEAKEEAEETKTGPVIEDVYDDMNIEKKEGEEEKPKSNSILGRKPQPVTGGSLPKALPYLIRVSTEERIMLSKANFKIGKATRGVDYSVSGNGAVSRQHAIIIQRDGVCYIKDNKSTNHTYVNDHIVEEGVEEILTHDSTIRLGDEEFTFKIR